MPQPATFLHTVPQCVFDTMDAAQAFLATEEVVVHKMLVSQTSAAGLQIEYEQQETTTRLTFYFKFIVWFVSNVVQNVPAAWPAKHKIKLETVQSALKNLNSHSPHQVMTMYMNFLFNRAWSTGSPVGFYAKDGKLSGSCKQLMAPMWNSSDILKSISHSDLLLYCQQHDGMSMGKAWVYSGGTCLAGHHIEDGFLHFVHLMLDIKYDDMKFSFGLLQPELCDDDGMVRDVLKTMQTLSVKRWLFGRSNPCTVHSVMSINNIIGKEFALPDTMYEKYLHARCFLLNPDYMTSKYPDLFYVTDMHPGQAIYSNETHSVIGLSHVCMAWNVCQASELQSYIDMEFDMACAARPTLEKGGPGLDGSEDSRGRQAVHFSLSNEVMSLCDALMCCETFQGTLDMIGRQMSHACSSRLWEVVKKATDVIVQRCLATGVSYGSAAKYVDYPPSLEVLKGCLNEAVRQKNLYVCHFCGMPLVFEGLLSLMPVDGAATHRPLLVCVPCFDQVLDVRRCPLAHITIRSAREIFWNEYLIPWSARSVKGVDQKRKRKFIDTCRLCCAGLS